MFVSESGAEEKSEKRMPLQLMMMMMMMMISDDDDDGDNDLQSMRVEEE